MSNDLFESFCAHLLHDKHLATGLFDAPSDNVAIISEKILKVNKIYIPRILEITQTYIKETEPIHYRQTSFAIEPRIVFVRLII